MGNRNVRRNSEFEIPSTKTPSEYRNPKYPSSRTTPETQAQRAQMSWTAPAARPRTDVTDCLEHYTERCLFRTPAIAWRPTSGTSSTTTASASGCVRSSSTWTRWRIASSTCVGRSSPTSGWFSWSSSRTARNGRNSRDTSCFSTPTECSPSRPTRATSTSIQCR